RRRYGCVDPGREVVAGVRRVRAVTRLHVSPIVRPARSRDGDIDKLVTQQPAYSDERAVAALEISTRAVHEQGRESRVLQRFRVDLVWRRYVERVVDRVAGNERR